MMIVLSPVLQAAKEKHMRAECFMVYNVLYDGVVECSNTLEDREDAELTPQAIVYQSCRERIYGILLPANPGIVYYVVITWLLQYYMVITTLHSYLLSVLLPGTNSMKQVAIYHASFLRQ